LSPFADARLLTPRHASPEQVRGAAITTASDIYSLGVLLYGLLSGRFPYQLRSTAPLELERAICDTEPAAPSRAVRRSTSANATDSPAETSAQVIAELRRASPHRCTALAGDLDNIVPTAMRKEPQRRYATARGSRTISNVTSSIAPSARVPTPGATVRTSSCSAMPGVPPPLRRASC
jgi:serine/threonine protein kinase